MKIIIAPDSFKGSLTAQEAASAMERGARDAAPEAEFDVIPMADGGEGTLEALIYATQGRFIETEAVDPRGRPMTGRYGVLGDGKTAVIEMAAVSGLLLLSRHERNPLAATTYGTGMLISHAVKTGFRTLIIAVGGSATNDCGAGMAQAVGIRFFRKDAIEIPEKMSGGLLADVAAVDPSGLDPEVHSSRIIVACDVENPLLGEQGCSRIYAPQKGASPEMVEQLEGALESFADVAEKTTGRSVRSIPGSGAAGGLAAGLKLFLGAEFRRGIDMVMDAAGFSERIKNADLILTGEGKIDRQTLSGKAVAGIAARARESGIPVIAFAGSVESGDLSGRLGLEGCFPISQKPISVEHSMADASKLLQIAVEREMHARLS